ARERVGLARVAEGDDVEVAGTVVADGVRAERVCLHHDRAGALERAALPRRALAFVPQQRPAVGVHHDEELAPLRVEVVAADRAGTHGGDVALGDVPERQLDAEAASTRVRARRQGLDAHAHVIAAEPISGWAFANATRRGA